VQVLNTQEHLSLSSCCGDLNSASLNHWMRARRQRQVRANLRVFACGAKRQASCFPRHNISRRVFRACIRAWAFGESEFAP
jgi:hypothetical protein